MRIKINGIDKTMKKNTNLMKNLEIINICIKNYRKVLKIRFRIYQRKVKEKLD